MDAFSVGDAVAIDGLMDPIRMACQVTTTYGLRCPPGTAEGTMLPVIWSAPSCAGFGWSVMGATFSRTLNLALPLRPHGYRLVAIAGSNENLDLAQRIAGITRFLFFESRGEPTRGLVVGMSDSGIRLFSTMCGSSVADMIAGSPWPSLHYLDQP